MYWHAVASLRFFFLLSILHTSSSQGHSSFIGGGKMLISLEKKPQPINQKTTALLPPKHHTDRKTPKQTNDLSNQKKQFIKVQLRTAQNSFQPLWYCGVRCLEGCRLQAPKSKTCTCSQSFSSYFCEKIHLFLERFVSPPHGNKAAPSHLTDPWSSFSVEGPVSDSYCSPHKSLILGSESVVQFPRMFSPHFFN